MSWSRGEANHRPPGGARAAAARTRRTSPPPPPRSRRRCRGARGTRWRLRCGKPGNSRSTNARITCSTGTKRSASPCSRMKRGIPPGIGTSPNIGSSAARTHRTTRLKPRLGMKGKGCAGSLADGREHREYLAHEVVFDPRPVLGVELRFVEHADVVLSQLGHQRLPAPLLIVHEGAGPDRDGRELFGRGHAVLARGGDAGLDLAVQAGDPHHVELVEVGSGDGEEAHPLQQGHARIPRFLEHPLVEREPGELAVDEALGRAGSDCGGG